MELIAFRVSMYKGIIDSGWVDVNNLTVFVGKNESGKTSLLKALHKLNPYKPKPGEMANEVDGPELYKIEDEWPRGLWAEKPEEDKEHKVCQAEFQLLDEEKEELRTLTDAEKIPDTIKVSRNYANQLEVIFDEEIFLDEPDPAEIDTIFGMLPQVQDGFNEGFKKCAADCLNEVKHLANERRFTELEQLVEEHERLLRENRAHRDDYSFSIEGEFINQYLKGFDPFLHNLRQLPTPHSEVHKYIIKHLPTFIYMDDYRTFTGNAYLKDIQSRKNENRSTEADKTFLMLLELSNLDLNELVRIGEMSNTVESRKLLWDVDSGATILTKKIEGRFPQRNYKVQYRVVNSLFFTYITDDHDASLIELAERSKGFQWDFSFELMLMHQTKGTLKGCIILLDEPGLHLHPTAQKGLLSSLEKYAEENRLLYTTHLPYMIDLKHPGRIRVLRETENDGSVVTTDLVESSREARFVLEAALGMDASYSFLVADRNLVVEGVHDHYILAELSDLLQADGLDGLPEDVRITPATGAPKAVPIVTFMIGQNLDVVALFDSDQAGRNAKKELVEKWVMADTHAILLGDAVGVNDDFAIEDLFPAEFYLEDVGETYPKLNEITLQGDGTLWKQVNGALKKKGIKNPNKGSVAKRLQKRLSSMKNASELPLETQEKAIKLFQTIRAAFGEEKTTSS